jgi:hypothetical protein
MMSDPAFVQVALDPSLIKGIYDACDQWCMYCPVTERCLAYRCNPDIRSGKQDIHRSLADRLYEGMTFLKGLCDAEGRPTADLDAMLSNDPRRMVQLIEIDDPIERMGRRYGHLSGAYLMSRPDFPFEMKPRASGPTPFEVFAWFHQLAPAKVYRALLSAAQAARGDESRRDDARISAKIALVGMDRSLDALAVVAAEDDDARVELLQAQLRRLRREVEGRFPDARSFVRIGLDFPPSAVVQNQFDGRGPGDVGA